jgi:capsular exopolysaccharide synthesis family protein
VSAGAPVGRARPRLGAAERLRRSGAVIVTVTIVAALLGLLAWAVDPIRYQADARLFIADPLSLPAGSDEAVPIPDFDRHVQRQADFTVSPDVIAAAAEDLGVDRRSLREQVRARAVPQAGLVVVQATAATREQAIAAANAVATTAAERATARTRSEAELAIAGLEEARLRMREELAGLTDGLDDDPDDAALQAERDALVQRLAIVQSRVDTLILDADQDTVVIERLETAGPATRTVRTIPWWTPLVAALAGLLGASLWAYGRGRHVAAADRREQPAEVLGAPLLGEIPDFAAAGVQGPDPTRTAPHSAPSEAYQFIVQALEYVLDEIPVGVVLVTSPGAAAGKSVTALNLAIAAAQDGRRVMLVDADERVRGLTRMQPVNAEPGLTNLADPAVPFDGCVASLRVTDRLTLPLVPAGSRLADPAGFFRSPAFGTAMARIKRHADLVIVDSPPFMAVADTSAIARHCDGILLVVAQGTPLRLLEDVQERLALVSARVLGYVFNRSRPRRKRADYDRFGYTYGYGYGDEKSKQGLVTVDHRDTDQGV